jgi:hypothetical protein
MSFDSSAAAGPAGICSIPGRKREVFLPARLAGASF